MLSSRQASSPRCSAGSVSTCTSTEGSSLRTSSWSARPEVPSRRSRGSPTWLRSSPRCTSSDGRTCKVFAPRSRRVRQLLDSLEEGSTLFRRQVCQRCLKAAHIENRVGRHPLQALAGEGDRQSAFVTGITPPCHEATAFKVPHKRRRAALGQCKMPGDVVEVDAPAGRHVMEQLPLVLRKVGLVAAAESHPDGCVRSFESCRIRTVHLSHG